MLARFRGGGGREKFILLVFSLCQSELAVAILFHKRSVLGDPYPIRRVQDCLPRPDRAACLILPHYETCVSRAGLTREIVEVRILTRLVPVAEEPKNSVVGFVRFSSIGTERIECLKRGIALPYPVVIAVGIDCLPIVKARDRAMIVQYCQLLPSLQIVADIPVKDTTILVLGIWITNEDRDRDRRP